MTVEQERQFLSRFFDQASHGDVLVVGDIKPAFEALMGHKVAKTTIYRMLDRHDWQKIMRRPRHLQSDTEAQGAFDIVAFAGLDRRFESSRPDQTD
jgi:hypothetical protein